MSDKAVSCVQATRGQLPVPQANSTTDLAF